MQVIPLGQKENMTYNIVVLDALRLAPRTHHVGVVVCNHSDLVDALLLQRVKGCDEAGKVLLRAGACKGPGHGHEDDLLVRKLYTGRFSYVLPVSERQLDWPSLGVLGSYPQRHCT